MNIDLVLKRLELIKEGKGISTISDTEASIILNEIERLNNIINELEEILEYEKNDYGGNIDIETHNIDSEFLRGNSWEAYYILNKLQELKGDGSNE